VLNSLLLTKQFYLHANLTTEAVYLFASNCLLNYMTSGIKKPYNLHTWLHTDLKLRTNIKFWRR